MWTYFMLGDWQRAIASDADDMRWATKDALPFVSGEEEAIAAWREAEAMPLPAYLQMAVRSNRFALEGNREALLQVLGQLPREWDPEGQFIGVRNLARVGATDLALDALESVVSRGFYCPSTFMHDPWLKPLRAQPRFGAILQRAEARSREAEDIYRRAGGDRLLGAAH
jgi:hypothetical protein